METINTYNHFISSKFSDFILKLGLSTEKLKL